MRGAKAEDRNLPIIGRKSRVRGAEKREATDIARELRKMSLSDGKPGVPQRYIEQLIIIVDAPR